jgi:hypothetical protein
MVSCVTPGSLADLPENLHSAGALFVLTITSERICLSRHQASKRVAAVPLTLRRAQDYHHFETDPRWKLPSPRRRRRGFVFPRVK